MSASRVPHLLNEKTKKKEKETNFLNERGNLGLKKVFEMLAWDDGERNRRVTEQSRFLAFFEVCENLADQQRLDV